MGTPNESSAPTVSNAVQRIEVKRLFGQFDYTLSPLSEDATRRHGELLILYGDNGSGKTTILNLLFHLLSAANNRGHRNALAHIPFQEFTVTLGDSSVITLSRKEEIVGNYHLEVRRQGALIADTDFDLRRKSKFNTEEDEQAFIGFLAGLQQTVYFLSADRQMSSDLLRDNKKGSQDSRLVEYTDEIIIHEVTRAAVRANSIRYRQAASLSVVRAMQLATEWIRTQNLNAAKRGTDSSHNIYAEIVRHLSRSNEGSPPQEARDKVVSTLRSLATRSADYARFGFTNPLDVNEMISALETATGQNAHIIENLLTPYINGTNARLDQLRALHQLTTTFIRNLNDFYRNKVVSFDLGRGFTIELTSTGRALDPEQLSSGEKQLLVLFCHTLVSNDSRSLFIIDEPELSLNIKWQRTLLRALLDIVQSGSVQFILATHSIELLSEHMPRVVKLEPPDEIQRFDVGRGGRVSEIHS